MAPTSNPAPGIQRDLADLASSNDAESESEFRERTPDTEDSEPPNFVPLHIGGLQTFKVDNQPLQHFKKDNSVGRDGRICDKTKRGKMEKAESQNSASLNNRQFTVHNVKRAINRYGTLPKGARIGAYLESLRQSGLSQGIPPDSDGMDAYRDIRASFDIFKENQKLPRSQDNIINDFLDNSNVVAMIRSNSTTSGFQPQSPLLARLSPRIHSTRYECKKNKEPTLAFLDFPPPPTDLPPPSEDYPEDHLVMQDLPPPPCSARGLQCEPDAVKVSSRGLQSPRSHRKEQNTSQSSIKVSYSLPEHNLQSTHEGFHRSPTLQRSGFSITRKKLREGESEKPLIKVKPNFDSNEGDCLDSGSTNRFGVNLRHRDLSSDSCDSLKSGDNTSPKVGICHIPLKSQRQSHFTSISKSPETSSSIETDGPRTPSTAGDGQQISPSPSSLEANRPSFEEVSYSSKDDSLEKFQEVTSKSTNKVGILSGLSSNLNNKKGSESKIVCKEQSSEEEQELKFDKENGNNDNSKTSDSEISQTKLVSELFDNFKKHKTQKTNMDKGSTITVSNATLSKEETKEISKNPDFRISLKKTTNVAEKMDIDSEDTGITFIPKLRKTDRILKQTDTSTSGQDNSYAFVDFRAQLRKTVVKDTITPPKSEIVENLDSVCAISDSNKCAAIILSENDFKYVLGDRSQITSLDAEINFDFETNRLELKEQGDCSLSDSLKLLGEDEESKRFSSSSISNLKKLWEGKDDEKLVRVETSIPLQTSPKYSSNIVLKRVHTTVKGTKSESENSIYQAKQPSEDEINSSKQEKKSWPPPTPPERIEEIPKSFDLKSVERKPSVPIKPFVKNFRPPPPSVGVKLPPPRPAGIYAIPSVIRQPTLPVAVIKKDTGKEHSKDQNEGSSTKYVTSDKLVKTEFKENSEYTEKMHLLDLSKEIEETISSMKKDGNLSSSTFLQLSSKVTYFQQICVRYVDNVPPQSRFRMRELLSLLEIQSKELRSFSSSKYTSHSEKLCSQVESTVIEISSTVRR